MKKINKFLAFTLTELLIALGVIGILAAVLLPVIFKMMPDQNTVMAKRALSVTQSVINNIVNDYNCYPTISGRVGIDDGKGYRKCRLFSNTARNKANEKFVALLLDEMDLATDVDVPSNPDTLTFDTKDGMRWTLKGLRKLNNRPNQRSEYITLSVDVNGPVKNPNCGQSDQYHKCDTMRNGGFDTFTMRIYETGKIQIEDCWAVNAVKVDTGFMQENTNDAANGCTSLNANTICQTKPTEYTDPCCKDDKWKEIDECLPPEINTCDTRPLNPDDPCCQNPKWKSIVECSECYPKNEINMTKEKCCTLYLAEAGFGDYDADDKLACCDVSEKFCTCKPTNTSLACCQERSATIQNSCDSCCSTHPEVSTNCSKPCS